MTSPEPLGASRRDRRRQRRRQQLIDAARYVIGAKGIHFTVADVTEAADVAIGSFYTYFRDKEDLFEAAVWEELHQLGDPNAPDVAGLPDPERARAMLYRAYLFVDTHRDLMAAVFGDGHLSSHYERGMHLLEDRVTHALNQEGRFDPAEIPALAALVGGMISGGIRYALHHPDVTAEVLTERTLRFLQPLSAPPEG